MNPAGAVTVSAVTKRFGPVVAVDAVDLAVRPGEFLTLLGPSGCGKTTLLRLISGFEHPDAGAIHLGATDVTRLPPYRRDVNQVFQSYALFPHLTVWDNIAFGLRMQQVPAAGIRTRVAEMLELVALEGLEHRRPDQLSGGQRQRVALARAIAPRPAVLLLDEPLSALDAKLRQHMQTELKGLQRRLGLTFVLVTHDQGEALAMSDRVAVMHRGRVEQVGTPAEIYGQPRSEFVAEFVGEANLLDARLLGETAAEAQLDIGGLFTCAVARARWPGSAAARVSLRPERVAVSLTPTARPLNLAARITSMVYHGAFHRLGLELKDGRTLQALVGHDGPGAAGLVPGAAVWCGIDPADLLPLRPDR